MENKSVSVEKMAEEILEGYPDWRFPDGVVMIEKSDAIAAMVEMYQAANSYDRGQVLNQRDIIKDLKNLAKAAIQKEKL